MSGGRDRSGGTGRRNPASGERTAGALSIGCFRLVGSGRFRRYGPPKEGGGERIEQFTTSGPHVKDGVRGPDQFDGPGLVVPRGLWFERLWIELVQSPARKPAGSFDERPNPISCELHVVHRRRRGRRIGMPA